METTPRGGRRSLQIAVIGSTYPRSEEDFEVPWLRESVNRIARRGHRVTVIAPAYAGLKDHSIDGIEVRRFRYAPACWEKLTHGDGAPNKLKKNPILKLLALTYILSGAWSAWKVCREKRIDVLHVHWPFPHGLMALLPAWLERVKVVSSCHSAEIALASGSKLSTLLLAACLRRSAAVTANSRHTADLIKKISGVDAEVIPYGATVRIEPEALALPDQPDVPLLLFSGRLIPRKGVDFLLRAMPLILEKRRVRLVVTGDGHCRAQWEALSRELGVTGPVEFTGFVSNERLSELFRCCTIYVHPAIYDERGDTEGLGVVLIEALLNRKPVVASRVGGIVDVIKDESTGLLVPEKNPEAIAGAVLRVLDEPALGRRLGEEGFAFATRSFDWGTISDQLEALYQHVRPFEQSPLPPKIVKESSRSRQILSAVRRLVPWVAVGCVVFALLPRAAELKLCIIRMNTEYLVIALALCLAYWFLNAGVWSGILASLGYPLPYFTGMRIWLTSESLRWLPGVIWKYCSRVTAASGLGVPVAIASISLPIELAVVVITWGIVAFAGLALSGLGIRILGLSAAWLVPICVTSLVVLIGLKLAWPVLSRKSWFRAGLDSVQTVLQLHLRLRPLIRSGLVYTGLNVSHGVGFWLMLAGLGYQHSVSPAAAIGANAVGWIVGSLALIFPGGIGVREASVALILSPLMPWQEATLAAALWRVLQIVAELASLLPWLFIGRRGRSVSLDSLAEERPS